jgi:hypothetical protein
MSESSDSVFVYEGGRLSAMPSCSFRDPSLADIVRGKTLEAALQSLIENYPELLPGGQIDPTADSPPRFIVLQSETPVAGGSVDLLLVDDRGVLTLVETKLVENREARRSVIGQILEYAANAAEDLGNGAVRRNAESYWTKQRGKNLDDQVQSVLGWDDVDAFWAEVEKNLQEGKIRLIIAADRLRSEARRIIEYLNQETRNVRIYGLEIRPYAQERGRAVIVPRLIGQTQSTADAKETAPQRVKWTLDRLHEAYATLVRSNSVLGARLRQVLDWAVEQGLFMETITHPARPAFLLRGALGEYVASFYADGAIYCRCGQEGARHFLGGADGRNQVVAALKQLGLLDASLDPNAVISGRQLKRKLHELTDEELHHLLAVFERFLKP